MLMDSAAQWGAAEDLFDILSQDQSREKAAFWKRIFQLHPSSQERLKVLESPEVLFRTKPDLPIFAGVLLAIMLSGFTFIGMYLFVILVDLTFLAVEIPTQIIINISNPIVKAMSLIPVVIGLPAGLLVACILGLAFLLVASYLMVGTVGLQVERESILDLLSGRLGFSGYLKLVVPAILIAVSLEVGFIICPGGGLAPISTYFVDQTGFWQVLHDCLLMLVWVVAAAGLTWLWLFYSRFFSIHLLGAHMGSSTPKFARLLLSIVSSTLLWILYIPAVFGQILISHSMTNQPLDPSVYSIFLATIPDSVSPLSAGF